MLKALIFDFDGLILDTETPELDVLQEIYAEYGCELSVQTWGQIVGGSGAATFDPVEDLKRRTGLEIPRDSVLTRWRAEADARIEANPILPGVLDLLQDARHLGLKMAIASSSPHAWVDGHLARLGLRDWFETVLCAEDVTRVKPSPELYELALRKVNVRAEEAVVFEDSPNGVLAAKRAGIYVVAVPNPITEQLSFDAPDLLLDSLSGFSLEAFLERFS